MEIEIEITEREIELGRRNDGPLSEVGGWVEFTGIVRSTEGGQPISALCYEAYQPMAENQMRAILNELSADHPCLRAKIQHRIGVVPVRQAAIYIGVEARHRAEAFALASQFMDRLKQDVPIWKVEVVP